MSKKDNFRDGLASTALAVNDFWKANGTLSADHDTYTEGPSLTRQEFMAECDINTIMAQYDGYLSDPMRSVRQPMYVDLASMPDNLVDAMAILNEARDAFYRLPAVVRRDFDNDPVLWADFASDPANVAQMREWGMAAPEKVPEPPMKVEITNPPESSPEPAKGS
nr:MAG: internal scaffolding protein [Microvirus sp.]